MSQVEDRLRALGVNLPEPAAPAANYVPFVLTGAHLFVAGQIPKGPDGLMTGKLGAGLDIAAGQAAARLCAIHLIAQAKAACGGDLDRVRRVVKLGAFVNCAPDFTDIPLVANGASDLMVEAFGDRGRHARFAVGAPSLPMDVSVEIDAVFEIAA
ncbi:MAG: RidA family protein [Caulobacterales bacterium]|nr:RidA family protein [Caulobacterales bacterium]